MREAFKTLNLEHLYIVYPGNDTYHLDEKLTALSMHDIGRIIDPPRTPCSPAKRVVKRVFEQKVAKIAKM